MNAMVPKCLLTLRLAAAVALAVACGVAGPREALAELQVEEVDRTLEGVYAGGDYQRELPLYEGKGDGQEREGDDPMADPDWWRNEGDRQASDVYRPGMREPQAFDLEIPEALAKILRFLMWIVIFVGVALLAYFLLNEVRLFSRGKKDEWREENGAEGTLAGGAPGGAFAPGDYNALAAQGEYAEAVHALLLHSIAAIRQRGVALSSSLTSREILRRAPLDEAEKNAFETLVSVTEFTHFGRRQATEADFLHCRDLFGRIAAGGRA